MERVINREVRQSMVVISDKVKSNDAVTSQTYYLINKGYLPLSYKIENQNSLELAGPKKSLTISYIYIGKRTARNWLLCHALRKEFNANRSIKIGMIFNKQ